MKVIRYKPQVRSKNYSCQELRNVNTGLGRFPVRSIVRLGSRTPTQEIYPNKNVIEVNTVDSIENSRSKLLMKECFAKAGVKQSRWWDSSIITGGAHELLSFPIVAKRIYGFKGHGMFLIETKEDLDKWLTENKTDGYYFEEFKNFNREYRLHCTKDGCFYSARKMLKSDTPEDNRWYRNDSNCIWVTEYTVLEHDGEIIGYDEATPNEAFDKPVNWKTIENDCVNALKEVGLSIGAFDVRVQASVDKNGIKRDNPDYIIIEVNSAPSFGKVTLMQYKRAISKIINNKYKELYV